MDTAAKYEPLSVNMFAGGPNPERQTDAVELPVRHRGHDAHVHAALAARGVRAVHPRHGRR